MMKSSFVKQSFECKKSMDHLWFWQQFLFASLGQESLLSM
jgi:hypothetical protein